MTRLIAALFLVVAAWAALPAGSAEASEADARKAYQQRTREVREAGDPQGWLELEAWIGSREDVSEKTRERWLVYVRHQYGVAARKKLDDDDVDGWIELAQTMERLLGSDSTARSYLRTALKRNPDSERLATALGSYRGGEREVSSVLWAPKKEAAEKESTPEAFARLARWCAAYEAVNPEAKAWRTYCVAREIYLAGREGGPDDPIRLALDEAARVLRRPMEEPPEPKLVLPSHLGKREHKGLRGDDFKYRKRYRLESAERVSYADEPPATGNYDAVWKRGSRVSYTFAGHAIIWTETHPTWWRLKWDAERGGWVKHTMKEHRTARYRQIKTARGRLAREKRNLREASKRLARLPVDAERSRAYAEKVARQGGKATEFRRALASIVSRAESIQHHRRKHREARLAIAAWSTKILEMTPVAEEEEPKAEMDDPPKAEVEEPGK